MKVVVLLLLMSLRAQAGITQHFEAYGVRSYEQLKTLEAWGFDQFIIDSADLLEIADGAGFRVIQPNWFKKDTPWETVRAQIERASRLKNLLSVNLIDEPIFYSLTEHPPEYYIDLKAKIKALYPNLPLSVTENGPRPNWPQSKIDAFKKFLTVVDHIRIDPYPVIGGRPLSEVYEWHKLTKDLLGGKQIPITNILQTWTYYPDTPKLPTITQLRVMAYEAMLLEAEALSFFDYNPTIWGKVPGFTEGFIKLMKELTSFSTKYRSCSVKTTMTNTKIVQSDLTCDLTPSRYQVKVNTNSYGCDNLKAYEVKITPL